MLSLYKDRIILGIFIVLIVFIGYEYTILKTTIASKDTEIARLVKENADNILKNVARETAIKEQSEKIISDKETYIDIANKDLDEILDEAIKKINHDDNITINVFDRNSTIGKMIDQHTTLLMDDIAECNVNNRKANIRSSQRNILIIERTYRNIIRRLKR